MMDTAMFKRTTKTKWDKCRSTCSSSFFFIFYGRKMFEAPIFFLPSDKTHAHANHTGPLVPIGPLIKTEEEGAGRR